MSAAIDPARFYRERVPAEFNRIFESSRRAAENGDENAARVLAEMRSVRASIAVRVLGDADYALDIEAGLMRSSASTSRPPFITLVHDLESFRVLERESGGSVLGFLGAIAGMGGEEMKLTSRRVQNLHRLRGSLLFTLSGTDAFSVTAHFGDDPIDSEPNCTISLDRECYDALRSGRIDPQDAFLSGRIEVKGDMETAMGLALAALSPE